MTHNIIPLFLLSLLISCGPSKFVEPIAYKQISVGGHFGGPLIDQGAPIPLPITAIEIGYGIDTNITIFGGLHTTAILFGNLQIDIGSTFKVLDQEKYRPSISITPGFNCIYSFSESVGKFWPTIDANAYWNYGQKRSYLYFGFNNYFELISTTANNQPQANRWLFNPQIGHVLKGKKGQGQFTTEIKWLGPNQSNDYAFIPYSTPHGNQGAIGIYLGYRWLLNNNIK
ncbi:MAG: hypothetical protein AB8B74_10185 [Crocinitomicaceae bacterium]